MKPEFAGRLPAFLLCITLLVAGGCKALDINPDLPAETQEGKNTFGCRVDGTLWLPYTEHTLDRAIETQCDTGWFTLRAEREKGDMPYINLQLADSTGLHTRTYTQNEGFFASVDIAENGQNDTYITMPDNESSITLTKAESPAADGSREVIISGTFSFVATSTVTGKKVTVKDGRFDVKTH